MKIARSDLFVFLDTVSFQKNGVQNRNTIKTMHGIQWLTVPVMQKLGNPINEVRIVKSNWQQKHFKSLLINYKKAKYFERYLSDLQHIYLNEWDYISVLNIETTKLMMRWLGIEVPIKKASELGVSGKASDLLLSICKKTNASIYISGIGGKRYINETIFSEANVSIEYLEPKLPERYPQLYPKIPFVPDLSALDIIFNCGQEWSKYIIL
jgi:hypothetical protein